MRIRNPVTEIKHQGKELRRQKWKKKKKKDKSGSRVPVEKEVRLPILTDVSATSFLTFVSPLHCDFSHCLFSGNL